MNLGAPKTSDLDREQILRPISLESPVGPNLRHSLEFDDLRELRRTIARRIDARLAAESRERRVKSVCRREFDDPSDQHWLLESLREHDARERSFDDSPADIRELLVRLSESASDYLTSRSKDLQVAAWLLEAQTRLNGLTGAAAALKLIRELSTAYWDSLHPLCDPEAEMLIERRAGLFGWIDDTLSCLLLELPLTDSGVYSIYRLADFERSLMRTPDELEQWVPELDAEDVLRATTWLDRQTWPSLRPSLGACRAEIGRLREFIDHRRFEQSNVLARTESVLDRIERLFGGGLKGSTDRLPAAHDNSQAHALDVHDLREREYLELLTDRDQAISAVAAEFSSGRFGPAMALTSDALRVHPDDLRLNLELLRLLCYQGDLSGAWEQLGLVETLAARHPADAAGALLSVDDIHRYRNVIDAESKRRNVFGRGWRPQFFVPPPVYVERHLELVTALAAEEVHQDGIAEILAAIDETAPRVSCRRFTWKEQYWPTRPAELVNNVRDADVRLGSIVEVFLDGRYFWVPMTQIVRLKRLANWSGLWLVALLEMHGQPAREVVVPATYVDAHLEYDWAYFNGGVPAWRGGMWSVGQARARSGRRVFEATDLEGTLTSFDGNFWKLEFLGQVS